MSLSLSSAYEQAVRDQRLRLELSQVRRQNNHFLENVERSKQVTAIVDRKKKRGEELLEVSIYSSLYVTLLFPPLTLPSPLLSPSTQCEDSDNAEWQTDPSNHHPLPPQLSHTHLV